MDVFAGLLAQGQKAEAQLRYALRVEQEREQQMEADRETLALALLREALGLGPEEEAVWQALAPEYHGSGYVLWAYGVKGKVFANLSGWVGDALSGKVSRESLALFVLYAQNIRAQVKALVIQHLTEGHDVNTYGAEQQRAQVARGLWDEPEVQAARRDFLYRTRPQDITTSPGFWWYKTWLAEAALLPLDAERAEVLALQERAAAWHDLQWRLTMAEGDVLPEEQLASWRAEAQAFGADAPQRWFELLARLEQGLVEARAAEAWLTERAQLEAAAFFPFRYYAVGYGYLTEDESGIIVETDTLPTLHLPDADGWIVDERNGYRVQVRAITTVTEVPVRDAIALPTWPGCWRGEGRRRYLAPPAGAERL